VFTCSEKLDQPKCNCTEFPRLEHCLCPKNKDGVRGIRDFDGVCINVTEAWHDKTLFKIGDFNVTTGTITATGGVLIAIGVIVFAICSYISWKKRKEIASGARRASDYVRRASTALRASISGRPAEQQAAASNKDNFVNDLNKDITAQ